MKKDQITEAFFVESVKRQKDNMFRIAYGVLRNKTEAEDAVSEAVLRAWEKRNKLRDQERITSWLLKIVLNISKTMVVKRKREKLSDDMEQLAGAAVPPAFVHIEQKMDIWQVLMALKEKYRTVIIMFYYSEFTIQEISDILRIPEGTVKNRLYRAREILKIMLE